MGNHRHLRRIVIETDNESAPSPDIQQDYEGIDNEYLSFENKYPYGKTNSRITISDINLNYWTVKVQYEYSERFKKVSAIVGDDLAAQVLDALDK